MTGLFENELFVSCIVLFGLIECCAIMLYDIYRERKESK